MLLYEVPAKYTTQAGDDEPVMAAENTMKVLPYSLAAFRGLA